jgi:FAD:protein FMN transferase
VEFNGKRYTHIIDPRTGYPSSGIASVTIFAPKAELADALATSVFVMGIETGLDRINQLPQVECIIIDDAGHISKSNNIEIAKL